MIHVKPKLTEPEKALLINVVVGAILPFWIPVPVLIRVLAFRRTALQARARRLAGRCVMIGALVWAAVGLGDVIIAATAHEPAIPPSTPPQLFSLDKTGSDFKSGLVIYREGQPLEFDVAFGESDVPGSSKGDQSRLETVGAEWAGDNARLILAGNRVIQGRATRERSEWPERITDRADRACRPRMRASLPLAAADLHRELDVRASMHVDLPYRSDGGHYRVGGIELSRRARLFVVTREEMALRSDRQLWVNRRGTLVAGSVLLVVGICVAWLGWRSSRRASTASPSKLPAASGSG